MNKTGATGVAALLITGFAILYAGGSAVTGWAPSSGWLIQMMIHVGETLAVIALALSWAARHNRIAVAGLTAAVAGQLLMAAAEVIWPHDADLGNVLFSVSPLLTGAGLITAGVFVARTRAWAGPTRLLPLILGLYTLLVLIPTMIGSGGPPAPLALWVIAGWDVLWCALSAAVLARTPRMRPSDPATAKVIVR